MGTPVGSFLESVSEHNLDSNERISYMEESESETESTQIEEDLALVGAVTSVPPKSRTMNGNQKRHKTSASGSPGSSTPGSDESHADDEGENLTAKASFMETLENMWAKKKEFETFKENRKQERHDQIIALEKEKIELKKKDLELRRWVQDNRVMSMDISAMSAEQQKYFSSLQDEIFARRFGAGSV